MARARRLGGPGYEVVEQARVTIERHGMLSGGETVVVALSGGPDSTCLLDVLWRLSDRFDLLLAVAHVDHGLSDAAAEIARRVARGAADAGFDVHLVRAPDLAGPNLQSRARDFRYGFLDEVAAGLGGATIATGHTMDDRVETTLARLVHGGGTAALAGIPPATRNRIRPLIELRRAETRAYCAECSLEFSDDPANRDPRFERVAIRTKVVAAIESHWGDGAVRAMATSSGRLGEDARGLSALTDKIYDALVQRRDDGVSIALASLQPLPRALRRRVLERAVGPVRDRSGGIDAVLEALEHPTGETRRYDVAEGNEITLERDELRIRPR